MWDNFPTVSLRHMYTPTLYCFVCCMLTLLTSVLHACIIHQCDACVHYSPVCCMRTLLTSVMHAYITHQHHTCALQTSPSALAARTTAHRTRHALTKADPSHAHATWGIRAKATANAMTFRSASQPIHVRNATPVATTHWGLFYVFATQATLVMVRRRAQTLTSV